MNYELQDGGVRGRMMPGVKRVVVKVGTRLLMDVKGSEPAQRIEALVDELIWLREQGLEVVLVTSGAIGAALRVLNKVRRPKRMEALQAYAALGQCSLMSLYEEASSRHGVHCAQLLLTAALMLLSSHARCSPFPILNLCRRSRITRQASLHQLRRGMQDFSRRLLK